MQGSTFFFIMSLKYILIIRNELYVNPDSAQVWLLSQEAPPGEELDMKPKMEEEDEEVFEDEDDKDDIRDYDPGDLDPGDLDQLDLAEEPLIAVPGKRFNSLIF